MVPGQGGTYVYMALKNGFDFFCVDNIYRFLSHSFDIGRIAVAGVTLSFTQVRYAYIYTYVAILLMREY